MSLKNYILNVTSKVLDTASATNHHPVPEVLDMLAEILLPTSNPLI